MKVDPPGSSTGHARPPQAGEFFTDREIESRALSTALQQFRYLLDAPHSDEVARRNVLTYYGMGGIGKSALSERLETWVKRGVELGDWGPPPDARVDATARIDLHSSAGQIDILAVLLALRQELGRIQKRWPAFDLLLAAYWSAARPGEPLPRFRGGDELTDSVVRLVGDVLGDAASAAEVVGVGTGSSLAVGSVRRLIGEIRRRRELKVLTDSFPGFEAFLLRCADEPSPTEAADALLIEVAATLAWELSRLRRAPLVCIFVDTVERLALDPRRVAEGYLNALIYSMPNVFFVLTGRRAIDWYDARRTDLPHRGELVWIGLAPGANVDSRQHLIGDLSTHDARTLVLEGRALLALPMSDQVVDALVAASRGLPQYLELARQVAINVKTSGGGRQVAMTDVTGSLTSLVQRILDDVPADEQRAIRAACLFQIFDVELVASAAAQDFGCVERAVRNPMINEFEGERFPYRIHDAVRDSIRQVDHQVRGGWSERDWELAASRAVAATRRLHDQAKAESDFGGTLDAIGIAIRLVCGQDCEVEALEDSAYADWLSKAIVYSPSIQGLRSRIPAKSDTAHGQRILDFITSKCVETPLADRVRLLREIFESDHPLKMPAGRHLGYALKNQHRWDEALAVFDEVVAIVPSDVNMNQRFLVLNLARRFSTAREAAAGTSGERAIRRMAEFAHGLTARYFEEVAAKLQLYQKTGREREYLEEVGDFVSRRAFLRHDVVPAEIEILRQQAEVAGHLMATRSALLASILLRRTDSVDRDSALQRLRTLDEVSSSTGSITFRFGLAEFLDALADGNFARLENLRQEANMLPQRNRSWIPVECFFEAIGLPLNAVDTEWLEPYSVVVRRWTNHLARYATCHNFSVAWSTTP